MNYAFGTYQEALSHWQRMATAEPPAFDGGRWQVEVNPTKADTRRWVYGESKGLKPGWYAVLYRADQQSTTIAHAFYWDAATGWRWATGKRRLDARFVNRWSSEPFETMEAAIRWAGSNR